MLTRVICIVLLLAAVVPRYGVAGNILIMGDSLSAAFGIPIDRGWVNLLRQQLQTDKKLQHWQVVNASVSGETSTGGLLRLPALLTQHKPQLCILELGANDGLRGQSVKRLRQNLVAMIEQCQAIRSEVVLLGILLPPNYGKAYTDAFRRVYSALSDQYQIGSVPFFLEGIATQPELMQADGLHPNAEAQSQILVNVWPTILAALKSVGHRKVVAEQ